MRVHILLDGRDVPDGSSIAYTAELEQARRRRRRGGGGGGGVGLRLSRVPCAAHVRAPQVLAELRAAGCDARVASGGGRMYITMDRYEADWAMVRRGWAAHVLGQAEHSFSECVPARTVARAAPSRAAPHSERPVAARSPVTAVTELRKAQAKPNDQYLPSFVITGEDGQPCGAVADGDAFVLFNFRADRMVEMSKAFEYDDAHFTHFDRVRRPDVRFAGLMQYDGDLKLPTRFLVPPPTITHTSGEWLSKNGLKTFACSETQKFGHVTFFWNGNRSGYFDAALETYVEIPSDNVPFDTTPAMKAPQICAAGLEALRSRRFDVVRVNFANPDMVGHTGNLGATRTACEVVDAQVALLLAEVEALGGVWLVTADHGNADDMAQRDKKTLLPVRNADGSVAALTSHTLAPVPVAVGGPGLPASIRFRDDLPAAGLANVTATFLNLMGYAAPACMEPSLLTGSV